MWLFSLDLDGLAYYWAGFEQTERIWQLLLVFVRLVVVLVGGGIDKK
jgi:hypothetical protein